MRIIKVLMSIVLVIGYGFFWDYIRPAESNAAVINQLKDTTYSIAAEGFWSRIATWSWIIILLILGVIWLREIFQFVHYVKDKYRRFNHTDSY